MLNKSYRVLKEEYEELNKVLQVATEELDDALNKWKCNCIEWSIVEEKDIKFKIASANSREFLYNHMDLIPEPIVIDILKRIIDWTSSGGEYTDNYVKTQINYGLNYINEILLKDNK